MARRTAGDGRRDSRSLLRRRRISRPPGPGEFRGVRRIPRSLGGGVLGLFALIAFWAQLSGDPGRFLSLLGLLLAVTALAVWALVESPIRATFDQRWRPRRRIRALDTRGWAELATGLGGRLETSGRPRLSGDLDGVPYRLEFRRLRGARTIAGAVLRKRVVRKLVVYPRRANFHTRHDKRTGDDGFDRRWRVATTDPRLVGAILRPEVRRWIEAVAPERVVVRGRTAMAWCRAFVADADRLRGLVELVVGAAR